MSVSIGSNIASLQAQRRVGQASNSLRAAAERLASGQRINRASDDAAGLSIASSLQAGSRVYNQATRNLNDGISALNIADTAVQDLGSLVTRLRELATQSSNGTLSRTQRLSVHAESKALTDEYNRIVNTTRFNGLSLLDGSSGQLNLQLGYGASGIVGISTAQGLTTTRSARTFGGGDSVSAALTLTGPIVSADFNNDGIMDFASSDLNVPGVSVFLGAGDGTFSQQFGFSAAEPESMVSFDFNGDGFQDIASGKGAQFVIALNDGAGNFNAAYNNLSVGVVMDLAAGDLNGDGIDDLVVSQGSSYRTYLGNNAGVAASASQVSFGGGGGYVGLADQDGDGKLDLIAQSGAALRVLRGNGAGGFGAAITTSGVTGGDEVYTGDFNRDGIIDVIVAGSYAMYGDNQVRVYLGAADGTFSKAATYSGFGAVTGASVGDVDGDGLLDFVVGNSGGASIFFGNGDGTFSKSATLGSPSSGGNVPYSPLIMDFNQDGAMDIGSFAPGSGTLFVDISDVTTSNQMKAINLTTRRESLSALNYLNALAQNLQAAGSTIGSGTSRLNAAVGALNATRDNYTAAAGRILDADVASESATMTKQGILQQVASSVLAQANQVPALALLLLR